jgi:uncharacterized protein YdhG (YjbR/CyaY superfamily)
MLPNMTDAAHRQKVRAYYASLPAPARRRLRELRDIVVSVAPDAEEGISYRILVFRLGGRVLVYCAAWKTHTSLYPVTAGMKKACARELPRFQASKGTVRFPDDERLPVGMIKRLVKARVKEMR